MPRSESVSRLSGSNVSHPHATVTGPADANEVRQVTVVLPPRMIAAERAARISRLATQLPHQREYLNQREFAKLCGADPAHLTAIERFAKNHGLRVESSSQARRSVVMTGSIGDLSRAYRVVMQEHIEKDQRYLSHTGCVYVPTSIAGMVESVLGLDLRPVRQKDAVAAPARSVPFTPPSEVAAAYSFPAGTDGSGQTVGIILPGSGLEMGAVQHHFAHAGIPTPRIKLVAVLGARNQPCSESDVQVVLSALSGEKPLTKDTVAAFSRGMNTIESNMDVILVGSFAPKAQIVVYVAPDNHEGDYHALMRAITDPGHPSVISCSWSSLESNYTPALLKTMNTVFQLAALRGVTVCFSSGDDGDGTLWGLSKTPTVHFPSSSPYVLACGGTSLKRARKGFTEVAWSEVAGQRRMASGGGYSRANSQKKWQKGACPETGGRGVPDVSAKADVKGGYEMDASGLSFTMGGTSAAAPMWAALAALLNQSLGVNIGMVGPLFYTGKFRTAFHDVVSGDNGAYQAGPGWDPVTGWGSPDGAALLHALRGE